MKNLLKIFILFFVFGIYSLKADLYYPIQEMSKVDCRFQNFLVLGDDCKMNLPILKTSEYTKYKNDYNLYRRVYSVLWGASYEYGWDVGNGGHGGVDIASRPGTPVYSIADGKVVFAGNLPGRGNTVKIEHNINGKKIYSNYRHLLKIEVLVGDILKGKTKIGEVGNTGNSYGNHLHFQIDLAVSGKGPWYRSSCSEKNYNKIVNTGICFNELNNNTIDPLLFLETGGAIIKTNIIDKPEIKNIPKQDLLSREEILKMEIQDFLKKYDIEIDIINFGGNLEFGKSGTFRIIVTDKITKKPFNGTFPGYMNFKYDKNKIDIFPTGILQIDNGKRDFKITPKIAGKITLDVYIGEIFFKKIDFGVFDSKKSIVPKSVVYSISNNNVISENKKGLLYFKDNFGLNILGFRFNGDYILSSQDKSIKFCIKKVSNIKDLNIIYNTPCRQDLFSFEKKFSYNDTIKGILVFEYKVLNIGPNNLIITDDFGKKISSRKLNGILPIDLDVSNPYYEYIVNISKLGFVSGINKGYFMPDRDLSKEDGINFLKNLLYYKLRNCNDDNCINFYKTKIIELQSEYRDRFSFFTRIEYLNLISKYVLIKDYDKDDYMNFRDLSKEELINSKNILKSKTWLDYFGQTRYFQPTKLITRREGAFLISQVFD